MNKMPNGIPTPSPMSRGLSDVATCTDDDVGVDGGVVDRDVVVVTEEEVVGTGRHILTAVDTTEDILKYCLLLQQLVGSEPQQ